MSADHKARKAIILAGGSGTRLLPLTRAINKQLLPVYDKPMIYYSLTTLMLAGIREYVVVTTPQAVGQFETCLGDGGAWGVSIKYAIQPRPEGIAQAITISAPLIEGHPIALILGDNLFYGARLPEQLERASAKQSGATIFAYFVKEPERFGVVEIDKTGRPLALHEKPKNFVSHWAVPGLYFYDADAVSLAERLKPSSRGELEITDLNKAYLERGRLDVEIFGRGVAWLDGGTHEDLFQASQYVEVLERRTGLKIACPEEIAYRKGFISLAAVAKLADTMGGSSYAAYLRELVTREEHI